MKLNVLYIVREFVSVCVFVRANGTHSFPIKKRHNQINEPPNRMEVEWSNESKTNQTRSPSFRLTPIQLVSGGWAGKASNGCVYVPHRIGHYRRPLPFGSPRIN